jgi:hypothetical protein
MYRQYEVKVDAFSRMRIPEDMIRAAAKSFSHTDIASLVKKRGEHGAFFREKLSQDVDIANIWYLGRLGNYGLVLHSSWILDPQSFDERFLYMFREVPLKSDKICLKGEFGCLASQTMPVYFNRRKAYFEHPSIHSTDLYK